MRKKKSAPLKRKGYGTQSPLRYSKPAPPAIAYAIDSSAIF